jgi:broad specificity phosphatase PhoE
MKLFVLRHEKRGDNPLPLSPLTSDGFIDSLQLIRKINQINPDIIYCSPFLRTIETIYPYCRFHNKTVNIENSLYEFVHAKEFNRSNYIHRISDLNKNAYQELMTKCINHNYKSLLNVYDINLPEVEENLFHRVNKFMFSLESDKTLQNKKILFVTHMSTVNAVKSYFTPTYLETPFQMGYIEQVY